MDMPPLSRFIRNSPHRSRNMNMQLNSHSHRGEAEEAVRLICEYRTEMNTAVEQYMSEHLEVFDEGFRAMDEAIIKNDANGFIAGNTMIQETLGHEIQFRSQKEFDDLMPSDAWPLRRLAT